jgi:excisionase family DNA binding protein
MTNLDDYVSQTEAAEILGVDGSTVSRWSDQGRIKVVRRIGYTKLYRRSDVEDLRDELATKEASA